MTGSEAITAQKRADAAAMIEAEAALEEAADTVRRLPPAVVRARLTLWPRIVRATHEAYGYGDARPRLAPASPDAIDRLDRALAALQRLAADDQRLLWSRANGASWRRVAAFLGAAPNTCRARYLVALARFAGSYVAPSSRRAAA